MVLSVKHRFPTSPLQRFLFMLFNILTFEQNVNEEGFQFFLPLCLFREVQECSEVQGRAFAP